LSTLHPESLACGNKPTICGRSCSEKIVVAVVVFYFDKPARMSRPVEQVLAADGEKAMEKKSLLRVP
jgi:hypothetical protein